MKSKIESIYSNKASEFVEPNMGVKPISCKWSFEKKRGEDGNMYFKG